MSAPLFRPEVIEHRRRRLLGTVVVSQPVAFWVITAVLTLMTCAVGVFLYNATYTRKETVIGFLAPSRGLIEIEARGGGMVTQLHVADGALVVAGQALVTLRTDADMADGVASSTRIDAGLRLRAGEAERQLELLAQEARTTEAQANARVRGLEEQSASLRTALPIHEQRAKLAAEQVEALGPLLAKGFASRREMQAREQEALAYQAQLSAARVEIASLDRQIAEARGESARLPSVFASRVSEARDQIAAIALQRAQSTAGGGYTITAPVDGVVTGLQAMIGQSAAPNTPLITMRGTNDALVAELLIPTRAAGFVAAGQPVRLMYDAFPYQRYGIAQGRIIRVSRSIYAPGKTVGPVQLQEPVYRARVRLDRQAVNAFGQAVLLQPGMMLKADVILDRQSLADVILAPLRSTTTRW